jgi:hypothetical protein
MTRRQVKISVYARWTGIAIIAAAVVLSIVQFAFNRSLFIDEAWLALNITDKSFADLIRPLDHEQVAPILFLWAEKTFSLLIPDSELGLRLFSLLCYWASLGLFFLALKKLTDNPMLTVASLSLFVFNATLLYFSNEAKQYMSDMTAALAMFFLYLKYSENRSPITLYVLAVSGAIAIFLSNVAPIFLLSAGVCLVFDSIVLKHNSLSDTAKSLVPVFALWTLAFAVYYAIFVHDHPTRAFMLRYWTEQNGFLPLTSVSEATAYLIYKLNLATDFFPAPLPVLAKIIPAIIGLAILVLRRQIRILLPLGVAFSVHLTLSALHVYPFERRMLLYIYPFIVIIYATGFYCILKLLRLDRSKITIVALPVVFAALMFTSLQKQQKYHFYSFPIERQEVRRCVDHVAQNFRSGDSVYLYYFTRFQWNYLQQIGRTAEIVCQPIEGRFTNDKLNASSPGSIAEIDSLCGRTWLLFSHCNDEEDQVIARLDSLGRQRLDEFHAPGASVWLYDCGE